MIKINILHNLKRGAKFSPSLVTPLLCRVIQPTDKDTKQAIAFHSDVQLLTTQSALLSQLDGDNLQHYIETILPKSDPNAPVKNKASVEDLMKTCKSRYCQSLGDLKCWSEYLNELAKHEDFKTRSAESSKSSDPDESKSE